MSSEHGPRTLFAASPDAVIISDREGRIILWNPRAGEIFGYSEDEALGLSVEKIMPAEYRERHRMAMKRLVTTGRSSILGRTVEVEGLREDGTRVPLELSLSETEVEGKKAFMAVARDITKRKEAERKQRIRQKRLSHINSDLMVLYRFSKILGSTFNREALCKKVLRLITGIKAFNLMKSGGIFIVHGHEMELVAHLGHSEEFLSIHKGISVDDCLCGLVARTGEIIYSKNSASDERHTIRYPDMKDHGHVIVPLRAKGQIVGVMYLYLPPDTQVEKSKLELLGAVGNQTGIALNNLILYEKTKTLTQKDPLTELANRRLLAIEMKRAMKLASRTKTPLSVLMIDIDHFKEYNDTYGHISGDMLLKSIAGVFTRTLRDTDLVARYGGEEFCALLPDTEVDGARNVAERLRKNVTARTGATVSIGVAAMKDGMKDWKDLVREADRALYRAKKNGRDRVEVQASGWVSPS